MHSLRKSFPNLSRVLYIKLWMISIERSVSLRADPSDFQLFITTISFYKLEFTTLISKMTSLTGQNKERFCTGCTVCFHLFECILDINSPWTEKSSLICASQFGRYLFSVWLSLSRIFFTLSWIRLVLVHFHFFGFLFVPHFTSSTDVNPGKKTFCWPYYLLITFSQ